MSARDRGREGIVLVIVLVFVLLLASSIASFQRRATIDAFMVRNRDAAARAEALARGGVQLATALLLEDRLLEEAEGFRVESLFDVWGRVRGVDLDPAEDAELYLDIEDSGARLNLNALLVEGEDDEPPQGAQQGDAEAFLRVMLQKVIEEMPGRPEDKLYDVDELVPNLLDWMDADEVRRRGGLEDEWYQGRTPAYRAANQPLLSVDELRLVQGFDGALVEALAPYVGVFPLAEGAGVNPNTAQTWVLALLYHGDALERELAKPDEVASIVEERQEHLLCEEGTNPGSTDDQPTGAACVGLLAAADVDPSTVFPLPTWTSDVFHVIATARVGDQIERHLEVVLDRADPTDVRRLAWRMR